MQQSKTAIRAVSAALVMAMGLTASTWADSGDMAAGPSQEEYLAAKTIIRAYMAKQQMAKASTAPTNVEAKAIDPGTAATDADPEQTGPATHEVTNAGFSVSGSGHIKSATVTAISADGNDGLLMVGYPDSMNQEMSGRLVFQEDTSYYESSYPNGLCGFQFRMDGATNELHLESGCTGPAPVMTFDRHDGGLIKFYRDIAIGGKPFDGSTFGDTMGGGLLPISFQGNNLLTCNVVCGNHLMNCSHATDLTAFAASGCFDVVSNLTFQLCHCSQ